MQDKMSLHSKTSDDNNVKISAVNVSNFVNMFQPFGLQGKTFVHGCSCYWWYRVCITDCLQNMRKESPIHAMRQTSTLCFCFLLDFFFIFWFLFCTIVYSECPDSARKEPPFGLLGNTVMQISLNWWPFCWKLDKLNHHWIYTLFFKLNQSIKDNSGG